LTSVFRAIIAAARIAVNLAGTILVLAYVVLFAFEFFHAPAIERSAAFGAMRRLLTPSIAELSHLFGWPWPKSGSFNAAPLILAVVVIFVRGFIEGLIARLDYLLGRSAKVKRRQIVPTAESQALAGGRYAGAVETEQQRAALLKRFRQIEDSLRASERKPSAFQAYEELVKHTFEAHGVWKSTWTPDGVMACFLDRELALRAAQRVLIALEQFNKEENQLRTPFKIRCGMNEGDVVIFEDSALEKISDHAIDIAGHMQKYAGENELLISDVLYGKLDSPEDFVSTGREVDGFQTRGWTPQQIAGVIDAKPSGA
jgi:class 3 adenylate cyclase